MSVREIGVTKQNEVSVVDMNIVVVFKEEWDESVSVNEMNSEVVALSVGR